MDVNKNNKKPWYKRVWVWIGLIILVGIVANAASPKETPKLADGSSSGSSEQKTEQTSFKPGDIIAFDGKKVTVAAPERNWDTGNQFMKPDAGSEFVKVQVTIENSSANEVMYNTFDWKLQDSKGVIKNVATIAYGIEGALSSGQLAPGGKVAGFLVFEVPAGDTDLTLRYNPSFWSDKKIEVKL